MRVFQPQTHSAAIGGSRRRPQSPLGRPVSIVGRVRRGRVGSDYEGLLTQPAPDSARATKTGRPAARENRSWGLLLRKCTGKTHPQSTLSKVDKPLYSCGFLQPQ